MTDKALHIIVQAGGRGSRLRHHTWNKPKCLVSVQGKPLLYHLFDRFPEASFTVIGDYAYEQLEKYLLMNPPRVPHKLLRAGGEGTASGIAEALHQVPAEQPLALIWSDLIVTSQPQWPETEKPVVFTTSAFACRWTVSAEGALHESPASDGGIPGMFYFPQAKLFPAPPPQGEFVKWFAANVHDFELANFNDLQELGDFATLESANDAAGFSRFFNKVTIRDKTVEKCAIDPQYEGLVEKEQAWYREATRLGFRRIPKVLSETPFVLERIDGMHLYQIPDLSLREQRAVLADYLDALTSLHDKSSIETRHDEVIDVYLNKTISRVNSVASIIPNFDRPSITINGRKCRNVFADKHADVIGSLMPRLIPDRFKPIHGDATFSNSLIDNKLRTWFIDPRGYFSKPGIMGDPWYDFAKVFYSAVGGYDTFNRRKFKLHVDNETVEVLLEEPRYAHTAREIFAEYFGPELARIEVLHGLIWLALSGYARDDIDSVIGSFYLGLYWLEGGTAKL
jgi:GTP:adenosylcobinamide-phosphate guanylyltransferase